MKKVIYFLSPLPLFLALPAKAVCPVCVVAVGAGLGLSEYLGIDDSIAGLWVGGLLFALSVWTYDWLKKKPWAKGWEKALLILSFLFYYVLTIWPLYSYDFIGQAGNVLWGLDKLLLGIIIGSLFFLLASEGYRQLKNANGGKPHFPYQKVAMPVATLAILSFVFYLLTK